MTVTIAKTSSPVVKTETIQKPRSENAEVKGLSLRTDSSSSLADNLTPHFDPQSVVRTTEMSISIGPTSSHNVVQVIDPKKGEVIAEFPPRSASAIYALAQRWAQMMAK